MTNPIAERTTELYYCGYRNKDADQVGIGALIRLPDGRKETIASGGEGTDAMLHALALRVGLKRLAKLGIRRVIAYGQETAALRSRIDAATERGQDSFVDSLRTIMARFDAVDLRDIEPEENQQAFVQARIGLGQPPEGHQRKIDPKAWRTMSELAKTLGMDARDVGRRLTAHGINTKAPQLRWIEEGWVVAARGNDRTTYLRWNLAKVRAMIVGSEVIAVPSSEGADAESITAAAVTMLSAIEAADLADAKGQTSRAEELLRAATSTLPKRILAQAAAVVSEQLPGRLRGYEGWLASLADDGSGTQYLPADVNSINPPDEAP